MQNDFPAKEEDDRMVYDCPFCKVKATVIDIDQVTGENIFECPKCKIRFSIKFYPEHDHVKKRRKK